jgi:hypothetical protein
MCPGVHCRTTSDFPCHPFNTLNSIAGLVPDYDHDAAVSMIVGLSEFLPRATEDSHRSHTAVAV